MNRFELTGRITSIEEKYTRKGTMFHIATIDDGEGREVTTALWGRNPRVGDHIEISGHLISRNGFLNLATESTKGDLCSEERNPITFDDKGDDPHPLPDLKRGGRWRPPPPMNRRGWNDQEEVEALPCFRDGSSKAILLDRRESDLPF